MKRRRTMSVVKRIRQLTLYITALFLAVGYPIRVMADPPEATTPPSTTTEQAAPEKTYTYNASTGKWDSNEWYFNPTTGRYESVVVPSSTLQPTNDTTTVESTGTPAPTASPDAQATDAGIQALESDSNLNVDTTIDADAQSGDASVLRNTTGGNATSGDASSSATIINSVNSAISAGDNEKAAQFTYDVMGDVNGDIMLYPMMLKTMLEAEADTTSQSITARNTNQLTNNVTLTAESGNATVSKNTSAGNATTGSAQAVANIVNILNSMIAARQSFTGTINIYGSLEGDILIAPDFIPQMLASNKDLQVATLDKQTIETQSQDTIINTVALAAESGSAVVQGNTKAGSATTGDADTNVVIFNLSGHDIIASDSLLVFVNVLGKWVGVIVDAPDGATSALIGNNVIKNEAMPDLAVDAVTTNTITNNVTLVARTGDAIVADNTNAGNATSGNATALANIANISNTQVGIGNWFGILFINVFGKWYGSFGVNTSYGNMPQAPTPKTPSRNTKVPAVVAFIPRTAGVSTTPPPQTTVIDTRQLDDRSNEGVLAVATSPSPPSEALASLLADSFDGRLIIVAGSMALIALSALGLRRLIKPNTSGEVADLE